MPRYRVSLHGEAFPGVILGQTGAVGFYTTRFINASSPAAAEDLVLQILRNDPALSVGAEHKTSAAKVFVEELLEVPVSTEMAPNKGFTFYTMGTKVGFTKRQETQTAVHASSSFPTRAA